MMPPARGSVVIDGLRHMVRGPSGKSVSLGQRDRLRALLYLLGSKEGQPLSRDEIIERVWGMPYESSRHDNLLFLSVGRLRRLLKQAAGPAATLEQEADGYRLTLAAPFTVLIPRSGF
jgi:DNA-binding response OmpR family regulator